MKQLSRLLLLFGLCILCSDAFARQFPNYPIPQRPDTLRILGIGNSFTEDGMEYLPDLLAAAGIENVILGRITLGGCSLERHCREYAADTDYYTYSKSTHNRWETVLKKARLREGIADERWDIVIIQQVSGKAGMYLTYEPWLGHLVEIVELPDHPWFVGVQFHPELKSRPNKAHPLFRAFVPAAKRQKQP